MSSQFWSGLFSIVIIDLVLAGDNAIIIGLSARRLERRLQRKAIFWGTFGAVAIRTALTFAAVYLLNIPGLMAIGGAILLWIAYRLLADNKDHGDVKEAHTFGEALRTILIADTVMGLDNVLAVAGAAHGNLILVVLGLLISVPIVVWGSTLIMRLVERFPLLIYVGAAVLAYTAVKMIAGERLLPFFRQFEIVKWLFYAAGILAVLVLGHMRRARAPAR